MIRVVIFLIATAVIAVAAVWIADRPGDVIVEWPSVIGQPREVNMDWSRRSHGVCGAGDCDLVVRPR